MTTSAHEPTTRDADLAFTGVPLALGSVDTSGGEGRAFLQKRLRLYAAALGVVTTGWWLLIAGVWRAADGTPPSSGGPEAPGFSLGDYFLSSAGPWSLCGPIWLLVWLYCAGAERSRRGLHMAEAIGIATVGVLAALATIRGSAPVHTTAIAALIIVTRAIAVPSTTRYTAFISLFVITPAPFAGLYLRLVDGDWTVARAAFEASLDLVYLSLALAAAVIASSTIFGLRAKLREGTQLGQYTLGRALGEGGMGVVYAAQHALLRRPAAIKLLTSNDARPARLRRFEAEVGRTSELTHPNTVTVFDYGHTDDGTLYYVMELVDGVDLQRLVDMHGPQPPGRVIHILRGICSSLSEAHAVGLVHRDVKPSNVMLCERGGLRDFVKVLDFGLVKELEPDDASSTLEINVVVGTPHYLAPESIGHPGAVDHRVDLYAAGCVGYFLLTGDHVFRAATVDELLHHHQHTLPELPSTRGGQEIPGDLEAVVMSCLNKDPARRPADARAVIEALGACRDRGSWDQVRAASWWAEYRNAPTSAPDSTVSVQAAPARTVTIAIDDRSGVDVYADTHAPAG